MKFAEYEKHIRKEEFGRGLEHGRDQFKAQLTSAKERLEAMYEKRHLDNVRRQSVTLSFNADSMKVMTPGSEMKSHLENQLNPSSFTSGSKPT